MPLGVAVAVGLGLALVVADGVAPSVGRLLTASSSPPLQALSTRAPPSSAAVASVRGLPRRMAATLTGVPQRGQNRRPTPAPGVTGHFCPRVGTAQAGQKASRGT
ncbi:hypothetical protein GCM10025868_34990 [Angustibacter aerolatus]|uniref:Secreted protein n=1 Tax=Angustibacter aerolatus TaxID=1162965 RepID=A0ABQ6JM97_9ACTN|nr:hypothetical protein GCM10025868_34990 [Angustibacter aerolatus]